MISWKTLWKWSYKYKILKPVLKPKFILSKVPARSIVFQVKKEKDSYYKVLGVKPSSSQQEIKLAFYALAK